MDTVSIHSLLWTYECHQHTNEWIYEQKTTEICYLFFTTIQLCNQHSLLAWIIPSFLRYFPFFPLFSLFFPLSLLVSVFSLFQLIRKCYLKARKGDYSVGGLAGTDICGEYSLPFGCGVLVELLVHENMQFLPHTLLDAVLAFVFWPVKVNLIPICRPKGLQIACVWPSTSNSTKTPHPNGREHSPHNFLLTSFS